MIEETPVVGDRVIIRNDWAIDQVGWIDRIHEPDGLTYPRATVRLLNGGRLIVALQRLEVRND